jgi:excisionase family DNA binding protein
MSDRTGQDIEPAAAPDNPAAAQEKPAAAADMSRVPAFLSAREAATMLGVSERTVRRAIQKGEIHALKHAGAFQIAPAALEAYRRRETGQQALSHAATPDSLAAAQDIDAPQHQTRDSGQGAADAVAVLRELLAEERRKSDALLEASLIWQTRALQLQEQLKALEAGALPADDLRHLPETADVAQDANLAPQGGESLEMTHKTLSQSRDTHEPVSDRLALGWRRWWRRITGG